MTLAVDAFIRLADRERRHRFGDNEYVRPRFNGRPTTRGALIDEREFREECEAWEEATEATTDPLAPHSS
jgi:hypothetical protein